MPYPSPKYPFVLGLRLNEQDHAKLQALATALGQKRCETLRYLVRQAVKAEAKVEFACDKALEVVGVGK